MQIEVRDGVTWADIFWDDLCQATQEKLLAMMGNNGNYDVCQIGSINVTEDEEE